MGESTLFFAAGHGGPDRGNTSTGLVERDELIAIVNTMQRWCKDLSIANGLGGVVFLNHDLELVGEIEVLNRWKLSAADRDMAIDWHLDFKSGSRGGALVLYDETPYAEAFSMQFLNRWCSATGIANNGIHRSSKVAQEWRDWSDFGFCRPSWPGVIVELGCINHARDMERVRDPYYRCLAAQIAIDVFRKIAR